MKRTNKKINLAFGVLIAVAVILGAVNACQPQTQQPAILATPAAEIQPVGVLGNWSLVLQEEFDTSALSPLWYLCPIWYSCSSGGGTDQGVKAQAWFLGSQITQPGDGYLHLRADDVERQRLYWMQVSIWSRSGLAALPDTDTVMLAAGFSVGPARELPYSQDTRHFGLARDYAYLETFRQ